MRKIFLIIFLGILILSPLLSSAAGLVPCGGQGESPCQFCHLFVLFKNIVDFFLLKIVPPLAVLMLAIAGLMYIFAHIGSGEIGGKSGPALLSQANKLLMSVVWGLLIIFGAWIFVNTFFMAIGVADWTGLKAGWWKIDCPTQGVGGGGGVPPGGAKTGACCVNGNCSIKEQSDCSVTGGAYRGDGTSCSPNPCRAGNQTSQKWTDWLTYYEDIENAGIKATDAEVPDEIELSLLDEVNTRQSSGSKTYIASTAFSDSKTQTLESSARETRNSFGSAYQSTVNNTSLFVVGEQEYSNINKAYGLSAEERGVASSEDVDKIVNRLDKYAAYNDSSADVIIMNGDSNLAESDSTGMLIHEYSHSVANSLTPSQKFEYIDIYESAYQSGGFVSNYAKTNADEDFAETVEAYHTNNGNASLISNDPAVKRSIQERFDFLKNKGIVR